MTTQTETTIETTISNLRAALDNFMYANESADLIDAVVSSTKAGWQGSSYKVELFEDGTYRVLWAGQIGNMYETTGALVRVPAVIEPDSIEDEASFNDYDGTDEEVRNLAIDQKDDLRSYLVEAFDDLANEMRQPF